MMFWYDHGLGGWGWVVMVLSMLVFWGLLIAGVVWTVRGAGRPAPDGRPGRATAEEILAERFARGEIDEAEYWDRLAVVRGAPSSAAAR